VKEASERARKSKEEKTKTSAAFFSSITFFSSSYSFLRVLLYDVFQASRRSHGNVSSRLTRERSN